MHNLVINTCIRFWCSDQWDYSL